jgi:uncharacterized protein YrrD
MVQKRLELRPGALVVGTDDGLGRVDALLAIPGSGQVSGFVLREGLLFGHEVTVPIDAVERTEDSRVHVRLSAAQVDSLADIRARGLTRSPEGQEPPKAVGERVVCRDGEVGSLVLVFLDTATDRVTHLVVRRDGSVGRDTIVPVAWAREITDDPIVLDASCEQLERLPEYRPDLEITDAVSSVLWYRSDLRPPDVRHVTVRTRDGIVQLTGMTRTEQSRKAIDAHVRDIEGVLGVNDQLKTFEAQSAALSSQR